jgi:imidazolonepropionase-like amidohydrolase
MTPMQRLLCLTLLCLTLSVRVAVAQTGAAPATTAPPPKPTAVLIENVRVFDGRSERLSAPSNVLIVGNKIHSISAAPISPPSEATLTRVAGEGRTLMPGLIDNHVHIVMTASTMAQMSDPSARFEQIEARGAEKARQTLLRGFTTVRDLGGLYSASKSPSTTA